MAEEIAPTLAQPPGIDLPAYCAQLMTAVPQRRAAAPHAADRDGRLAEAAAAPARHRARAARRGRVDSRTSRWRSPAGFATRAAPTSEGAPIDVQDPLADDVPAESCAKPAAIPGPIADGFLDLGERVRRGPGRALRFPRSGARARDRAVPRRRARDAGAAPGSRVNAEAFAHPGPWQHHRTGTSMAIPLEPPPRPPVPRRSGHARPRAPLYATVKDLPIVSPHGHTDPQWFADDTPFANASALFITPDHYVFRMLYSQGVQLEDLGHPARGDGEPAGRSRRAQDLAHVRRALPPVPRHADAHLARPRVRDRVRHRRAADAGVGRPLLRPHQRVPRAAGVPAARAVRALQHRGASRPPSRRSIRSRITGRSARRAGAAASSPPIGPTRSSIPSSRASRATSRSSARSRAKTRRRGTATSRRTAIAARSSSRWARRRPTTGIRPRTRATCPPPNASGCSTARSPARSPRPKPRRSAARC